MIRKFAVATLTLTLTATTVVALAPPAAALAMPLMSVTVQPYNGGFRACAYGRSAGALLAVSTWDFEVAGTAVPVRQSISALGANFYSQSNPACIYVWKFHTTAGAFTASLTLVSDGWDLANAVGGTGAWDPVNGDRVTGMRTCGGSPC